MLETGIKWQMHLTSETFKSSSGLKTGPIKVDDNIETKKQSFLEKQPCWPFFHEGTNAFQFSVSRFHTRRIERLRRYNHQTALNASYLPFSY